MLQLCPVSGFRTDDNADELPSDALMAKRFWDQVCADANPPQPSPSGAQVMAAVHAEMAVAGANKALEASPTRVDDYRRPGPGRDYMQVPRVPDAARQIPGRP